jgi:integral membrane protein (TIGR01906 family)
MPYFPVDPYGFTQQDRLKWGGLSLEYLLNDQGIEFLGELRLRDGKPLYIERELSHMVDVKVLVQAMIRAWLLLTAFLTLIGFGFLRFRIILDFWKSVRTGAYITIFGLLAILIGVALSFYQLFTLFHRLFFEGDTWLFEFSDTLIRLFPLVFWRDAFALMGILTILGAIGLIVLSTKLIELHRQQTRK